MSDFKTLENMMVKLMQGQEQLAQGQERLAQRMEQFAQRLEQLEQRMEQFEQRMEQFEQRMEQLEQRQEQFEQRLEHLEQNVALMVTSHKATAIALEANMREVKELGRRVGTLESQMSKVIKKLDLIDHELLTIKDYASDIRAKSSASVNILEEVASKTDIHESNFKHIKEAIA